MSSNFVEKVTSFVIDTSTKVIADTVSNASISYGVAAIRDILNLGKRFNLIVFMGTTGVGKTTLIKNYLQVRDVKAQESTREAESYNASYLVEDLFGNKNVTDTRRLMVLDLPGSRAAFGDIDRAIDDKLNTLNIQKDEVKVILVPVVGAGYNTTLNAEFPDRPEVIIQDSGKPDFASIYRSNQVGHEKDLLKDILENTISDYVYNMVSGVILTVNRWDYLYCCQEKPDEEIERLYGESSDLMEIITNHVAKGKIVTTKSCASMGMGVPFPKNADDIDITKYLSLTGYELKIMETQFHNSLRKFLLPN